MNRRIIQDSDLNLLIEMMPDGLWNVDSKNGVIDDLHLKSWEYMKLGKFPQPTIFMGWLLLSAITQKLLN